MDKLYVVVRSDLPAGLQAAQSCHAMRLFAAEHEDVEREWFASSNNLVVLCKSSEEELAKLASNLEVAFAVSRFYEPDLDNELTAICVEPGAGRLLSTLPLALRAAA
jgi:peptidyl-tRNA hydrolase